MTWRAVPAHDELHRDGESLVLVDGRVQRVSALGTAVRELAAQPVGEDVLARMLEERFGAPPTGDLLTLTRAALADLVRAGLLERLED
ncbi:hypothetical protein [Ornithinimicrobium tianjinense]|uniref:hypothetical protein n=1 Tax=Ornithinimicrobium tianjinense TaxID=1195761 RepID=UPI001663B213|nr:hypothetical protein [Ornithinimicrobium tianjinense]